MGFLSIAATFSLPADPKKTELKITEVSGQLMFSNLRCSVFVTKYCWNGVIYKRQSLGGRKAFPVQLHPSSPPPTMVGMEMEMEMHLQLLLVENLLWFEKVR